ncbi:MAG: hypothetical protein A4E57_01410 [Syntrophorhabdaceae bacterium PtaU1.Bin034]|nr:MAG: hypothetical protein A4E57_01410 [Syntrophorhabdaceae bacterium PtaU1.Bin034]
MEEWLSRIAENLVDRVSGPMKFRLLLQPLMAVIFAVRSGLKDAREGRPPYFWALFSDPQHRREMVQDGWKSVGRVFILGIVMDAIYQIIVLRWFYPLEALVVAVVLAIVPYILVRGPVNRIARRK